MSLHIHPNHRKYNTKSEPQGKVQTLGLYAPVQYASVQINPWQKCTIPGSVVDINGKKKSSGSYATGDKITIKGTNESETFTIAVRGDVNGDASIDLKDFVLIQSHILEKSKLNEIKFYAGDVNFDGKIVLADFVLVQSHILKKQNL